MKHQTLEAFTVIGISCRTSNEKGQAENHIPALWNTFMSEDILKKIPGKISDDIYCIYTDYQKDHTQPYTTILGCKVKDAAEVPRGMVVKQIPAAKYEVTSPRGDIRKGLVFEAWLKIWDRLGPERTYTADFEVYGEKSQDPANAEVDIFIAVK